MKNLTCFFLAFALSHFVSGQNIQLNIHSKKLEYFTKLEQGLGSVKVDNKSNYISDQGVAQPEIYSREEKLLPNLLVYYFYYKQDSTISYILYEWDDSNSSKYKEGSKKSIIEVKSYIDNYINIHNKIVKEHGDSQTEGNISDPSLLDTGMSRRDLWKVNDSTEIEMYATFSNKFVKNSSSTTVPTYRTRLFIRSINSVKNNDKPEINEDKIRNLDMIANGFFYFMRSGALKENETALAALIGSNIRIEQMETLPQYFSFKDELTLSFFGIQQGADGSTYTMLQYKRTKDKNNPPKEMLKILFNNQNKIVGIQPLKRN